MSKKKELEAAEFFALRVGRGMLVTPQEAKALYAG